MGVTEDILADVQSGQDNYTKILDAIDKELEDIKWTAIEDDNRAYTDAENERRAELDAEQTNANNGYAELGFVSLAALNNSDQLAGLIASIDGVNRDLKGDLAGLQKLEDQAEAVSKIADLMDNIVANLAKLAK